MTVLPKISGEVCDTERLEAIKQIYKELLEREADAGGLTHYYGSDLSLEQIEESISVSEERQRLVRMEQGGGVDFNMVEHWLGVGTHPDEDKAVKYLKAGFTAVLDLSEKTSFSADDYKEVLHIGTAPNRVFSASEVEEAVGFIKSFSDSRKWPG